MSTPWADAARIVDNRRAAQEARIAAATGVVAQVSTMVEQFRQAIMADDKAAARLRFIASGELAPARSNSKKDHVRLYNAYEPERGRLFKFSVDWRAWAVDKLVEVDGEKVTIGPGGDKLLLDPHFDELIAAAERIPDWLPALLVQTLQEHDIPVPAD